MFNAPKTDTIIYIIEWMERNETGAPSKCRQDFTSCADRQQFETELENRPNFLNVTRRRELTIKGQS